MTQAPRSQAEYARRWGVSRQTVTDWKKRGLVTFEAHGEVDFDATDAALVAHGIRQPPDGDTAYLSADMASLQQVDGLWSKADAEMVKENFAARLKQLEYERESDKVVLVDDAVIAVVSEYALVRNHFKGIGSKIAPRLAAILSAEETKAIIDAEIFDALEILTSEVNGDRDFDKLRESVAHRFEPADEVVSS